MDNRDMIPGRNMASRQAAGIIHLQFNKYRWGSFHGDKAAVVCS
jgi:hypothetical protein